MVINLKPSFPQYVIVLWWRLENYPFAFYVTPAFQFKEKMEVFNFLCDMEPLAIWWSLLLTVIIIA